MDVYHFIRVQRLPIDPDVAWGFFSNPANLALITPPRYGLRDISPMVAKTVYPGYVYVLRMRAMGFMPVEWLGEITLVEPPYRFIDQQRVGPFKYWHHEHVITPIEGGVEIRDSLHYMMPFGIFGKMAHSLLMRRQMAEMFEYRARMLEDYFGRMPSPRKVSKGRRQGTP